MSDVEQDTEGHNERVYNLPEHHGPRNYGIKPNPEDDSLEEINKDILIDDHYKNVEDLEGKLKTFKAKFLEFEKDKEGNIDMLGLSRMLEKLGTPKTHLEMKKMINEVDSTHKGTICYRDFIMMMLGSKSSVLKLILMFEQKSKPAEKKTGVAPKRELSSLP